MELSDPAPSTRRQPYPNQLFSASQVLAHQDDQRLAFHDENYDDYEQLADQEYEASMVVGGNVQGKLSFHNQRKLLLTFDTCILKKTMFCPYIKRMGIGLKMI